MPTIRTRLLALTCSAAALTAISAQAEPRAYIANSGDDTVAVVDLASWSVIATIPAGSQPLNVAIHPTRPRVYVTNSAGGVAGTGSVSVIDTRFNTVVETLAKGIGAPWAVAVDPAGSKVFVGNDVDRTLLAIDTTTRASGVLYAGRTAIRGIAFDPGGSRIYFSRFVFNIMEAGASDGSSSGNFSNQQETGAAGVATDVDHVYWADYNSGLIRQHAFPTSPGATTLATAQNHAFGLALDDTSVYWVIHDVSGTLMQLPKAGGIAIALATDLDLPNGVALDSTYAYVTETGADTLVRIPLAGGPPQRLVVGAAPYPSGAFIGDNADTDDDIAIVLASHPATPIAGSAVTLSATLGDLAAGGILQFCDGGPANDARFCDGGMILCGS